MATVKVQVYFNTTLNINRMVILMVYTVAYLIQIMSVYKLKFISAENSTLCLSLVQVHIKMPTTMRAANPIPVGYYNSRTQKSQQLFWETFRVLPV